MAISSDYNIYQQNPYNTFGALTSHGASQMPKNQGYHQAYAQIKQGVPNTTPQIIGIPSADDMELAQKIAENGAWGVNNPFGVNKVSKTNELSYVTRAQNDSRELENSDVSGSSLGKHLDLQGCENKAWGKNSNWA